MVTIHQRLDVDGWLRNFGTGASDPHALHLLNSFIYYPDHFLNPMVQRAIRQLSAEVCPNTADMQEMILVWKSFLDQAILTFPTGEEPSPTDSGHDFARRAREVGFDDDRILAPSETVAALVAGAVPSAVLFVDDFVGTGNQFRETWFRPYSVGARQESFASLHSQNPFPAFYVPMFCTDLGATTLEQVCPAVAVRPLHLLTDRYSALNQNGVVWPDSLAPTGPEFIERWSMRAGIPDTGGTKPDDWRGFASLGLTLAFGRFVPDATLPIFYWKENGWKPLIQRH